MNKTKETISPRRKSEVWVSNNRVLNGGNKNLPGRNPNFETEETQLLISLWGDKNVQKTLIMPHKKQNITKKLMEKMRECGFHRSADEINHRIKNLKFIYNRINKDIETGILNAPNWKHYAAMDEIMTRPFFGAALKKVTTVTQRSKLRKDRTRGRNVFCGGANKKNKDDCFIDNSTSDDYDSDFYREDEILFAQELESDKNKKTHNISKEGNYVEVLEPLIELKEEPIDIDDNDDELGKKITKKDAIIQNLSSYLQSGQQGNIITTIPKSAGINPLNNTLKLSQPVMIGNQQGNRLSNQQGKIPFVPANFLLKSPHQQMQMRQQAQHILYNPGGGLKMDSAETITTSASGQVSMKYLLVNRLQHNTAISQEGMKTQQKQNISTVKSCLPDPMLGGGGDSSKCMKDSTTEKTLNKTAALSTLIKQLLQVENGNLEVSRQRFELEKQRLELERSIGERISTALTMLFKPEQQQQEQSFEIGQQQQRKDEEHSVLNHEDDGCGLLIPKFEKHG